MMCPPQSALVICVALLLCASAAAKDITLEKGTEKFIALDAPSKRISVGDESIVNVQAIDATHIRLLGLTPGTTTLSIWLEKARPALNYNVSVTLPLDVLRRQLSEDPDLEAAHLKTEGSKIILYGEFHDAESRDRAVRLANYVAGKDFLDMTKLRANEAVEVEVRFATLSNTTLDALGINFSSLGRGFSISTSAPNTLSSFTLNPNGTRKLDVATTAPVGNAFNLLLASPNTNILSVLSILKSANLARTLAEPTLLVRSGDPADFLVGGEVPIPVPQGGNAGTVTIEYKKFGIHLKVKPTIKPQGMISLEINPEVSELDFSNAVAIQGFTVPALRTRSTTTTVDLPAGQTLILAGLMFQSRSSAKESIPYISDVPLLGEFFKRTRDTGEEQQLVVAVTPRLVDSKRQSGADKRYDALLKTAPFGKANAQRGMQSSEPGLSP